MNPNSILLLRNAQKQNHIILWRFAQEEHTLAYVEANSQICAYLSFTCLLLLAQSTVRIMYQDIVSMYASLLTKQHVTHLEINIHQRTL